MVLTLCTKLGEVLAQKNQGYTCWNPVCIYLFQDHFNFPCLFFFDLYQCYINLILIFLMYSLKHHLLSEIISQVYSSTLKKVYLWFLEIINVLNFLNLSSLLLVALFKMFSKTFKLLAENVEGLVKRNLLSHSHLIFQKDPVSSPENMEEKKYPGDVSIPSPKPKLHSRDLKKELITWVTKNAMFSSALLNTDYTVVLSVGLECIWGSWAGRLPWLITAGSFLLYLCNSVDVSFGNSFFYTVFLACYR